MATATDNAPWGGYFQKELLPPARSFYERELGKLGRPNSKSWAVANCPFHRSESRRSFSVNLESGAFKCWGCDAKGGDVLAFVRLRDGSEFRAAARGLGAWSDVTLTREGRLQIAKAAAEVELRRAAREVEQQAKEADRKRRLALREEIFVTANIYREASERLSALRQGAFPAYADEEQHCWEILALALEDLRIAEAEYMRVCGFETRGCQ